MRYLCLALAIALAGCGVQSTPAPPIEVRTVQVSVPVPVPCVSSADIPIEPAKIGAQLNGDARHDLDIVSASALRLRSALDKALALLNACVSQ